MLTQEVTKKIEDFVFLKPRSVQEVAEHIDKNWRTADRYISEIETEMGTISSRVFREGTRGALKIVFWSAVEKRSSSVFQKMLEHEITTLKGRDDLSAFDIYQHVPEKNKKTSVESTKEEHLTNLKEFTDILKGTDKQMLVFSGNLSFINLKNDEVDVFKLLDDMVRRGVSIKVLCRVNFDGRENIEKLLSLNFKYGKELVEIRHREQPLRANIHDNKLIRMKEIKEPTGKVGELNKKLFLFYTIRDKEWSEWLSRIFWNMFSSSIDAGKRLEQLKKLAR